MKKLLLTAVALAALSTPATARDGAPYVGIEGGAVIAERTNLDLALDDGVDVTVYDNAISAKHKKPGWEVGGVVGYDFGIIRAEGEVSYKRLRAKSLNLSPALATDLGLPDTGPYPAGDFLDSTKTEVLSGMVNALVDFGDEDGVSFYAGGGAGRARVKIFDDKDSAWAWQLIAGVRYAISQNVDLGLKYRYFRTQNLDINGTVDTVGGDTLGLFGSGKLKTHSALVTLSYNFGGAPAAEPAPPPPPPPPPPLPPAMQTCPDGMRIPADQSCPPPPPPPPPAPERG